jgi:hypothetical protein
LENNVTVELYDLTGKLIQTTQILQGSTIWYLDTRTLYNGEYFITISDGQQRITKPVVIAR